MRTYPIYRFAFHADPPEAGRPTGLSNLAGREIHEGDVVEHDDALWVVQSCGDIYTVVNPENDDFLVQDSEEILRSSQIVGSIYEDPLRE